MNALRTVNPARVVAMRAPVSMTSRFYSPDVRQEGATATSEGFSKREQAEEGQYIKRKEQEQLKKAKEELAKAQAKVDEAQKKVDQAK